MPVDVIYRGSLEEFHGRIACAEEDPSAAGRYVLRLWDDPAGFNANETLRHVRRESFEPAHLTRGEGFVCRCGRDHARN